LSLRDKSDAEILSIADPIMDNLMDASTRIDHAAHTRDFSDRLKAIVSKEYLEKVCAKYQEEKGFFAEREFVAIFRRPAGVAVVWKQRFTRQEGEFVAEILIVEQDSHYLVDHVMVW
jgi:2C-methyl-D-erythritol 2,4-cyclodiphosphate synthase